MTPSLGLVLDCEKSSQRETPLVLIKQHRIDGEILIPRAWHHTQSPDSLLTRCAPTDLEGVIRSHSLGAGNETAYPGHQWTRHVRGPQDTLE
jgi:hypothetical protein